MIAFYENRSTDFYSRNNENGKHRLQCTAHLHYHLELVLMLEGHCHGFSDFEQCTIEAGDVFLAFPNQIHRFDSFDRERTYLFIINPDMMPELTTLFTGSLPRSSLIKGAGNDPEILALFRRLATLGQPENAFAEVERRGYLLTLFGKLLPHMDLVNTTQSDSGSLKTIVTYCTQNYTKELSLSVLEQELHISKYYISHLFSDKLHIGFNDYINSLRVSFACHHLRHSNKSVTEISDLVGFGTLRTFNRAFLKQKGLTPSEYRRAAPSKISPVEGGRT
ncbi:MAG: AraC family transcriptional regulator [Clostridia bacterium]|nr:AraC family transcriptional regulator [Clostridia bacterium]